MRKISAAVLSLGIAAAILTGCSSSPSGAVDCDRLDLRAQIHDQAEVTGDFGREPRVSLRTPLHVSESSSGNLITGSGTPITTAGQLLVVDLVLYSGQTGERLVATPFDGDLARVTSLADWAAELPGIAAALECATPGSRILAAVAPDDLSPAAAASFGLGDQDTVVAIIDLHKTYLPAANGSPQFIAGGSLPTVVRAVDGTPGITLPANTTPPQELVTEVLLLGNGDPVTERDSFRVHYTGVLWDTGEIFDSSWERGGPAQFNLDSVIPGFAEALLGKPVGSQVLIVIPPELGYGDQGAGSIPGGSTLVFVVDILGIDAPASE